MFTGCGQEPLTSPRARQDTDCGWGSSVPSCRHSIPGTAARAGVETHTHTCTHTHPHIHPHTPPHTLTCVRAHTHTNTTFLLPNPPHLNTISQDVGKISSLEGEKSSCWQWAGEGKGMPGWWVAYSVRRRGSFWGWRAVWRHWPGKKGESLSSDFFLPSLPVPSCLPYLSLPTFLAQPPEAESLSSNFFSGRKSGGCECEADSFFLSCHQDACSCCCCPSPPEGDPQVQTPANARSENPVWIISGQKRMLRPAALFQLRFPPPWRDLSRHSPVQGCRPTPHQLPAQQKDLLSPWGFKCPESSSYWLRLGHVSSIEQSLWPGKGAGLPSARSGHMSTGSRGRVYGLKL